jgi:hypothetical protein
MSAPPELYHNGAGLRVPFPQACLSDMSAHVAIILCSDQGFQHLARLPYPTVMIFFDVLLQLCDGHKPAHGSCHGTAITISYIRRRAVSRIHRTTVKEAFLFLSLISRSR